ncbi:unnamed protein product [Amaranthus hypochondriacus]
MYPELVNDPAADPILMLSSTSTVGVKNFDPISTIEAAMQISAPPAQKPTIPLSDAHSKRPRGRPKKQASIQTSNQLQQPMNVEEAQNTWMVAKAIGISSNDDEMVIAKLRKSKRMLSLEEAAPQ